MESFFSAKKKHWDYAAFLKVKTNFYYVNNYAVFKTKTLIFTNLKNFFTFYIKSI